MSTTTAVYSVTLADEQCTVIYLPYVDAVAEWLMNRASVSLDTETTGLNTYSPSWRLRAIQFGDEDEAIFVPVELFSQADRDLLGDLIIEKAHRFPFIMHNAAYDRQALDCAGLVPLSKLPAPTYEDTRIISHLIDPRAKSEGGDGHALKDLADIYIDAEASARGQQALQQVFADNHWSKASGWEHIAIDHPTYVAYGGLDCILTARLYNLMWPIIVERHHERLYDFEKDVADIASGMQKFGLLVDTEYVEASLIPWLEQMAVDGARESAQFGVLNPNSTSQVAEALIATGWTPTEFTSTGKPQVDKAVLQVLAEAGNPVAAAVQKAKRGQKWLSSFAMPFLELVDVNGRLHPSINPLTARTARMSIKDPAAQTYPSGDWRIRRAIIADPGRELWTADYSTVEMRVLAAVADERSMKRAFVEGADLHSMTAAALFGDDFTPQQRKIAKQVGFGKIYGGGATTLARQAGITIDEAKAAMAKYDTEFPGIRRYARRLQDRASVGRREVITASGRRLPLDADRLYAATNYVVQSTSRDVLCQAMIALVDMGFTPENGDLLLPVHDELLGMADPARFSEVGPAIKEAMTMTLYGVELPAEPELIGRSWGHAYGAPD